MKEGMTTVADMFLSNGYETAIFGKWHLGENYPFRPMDRGFKESVVHGGGGVGSYPGYWGNDYFDDTYMHNGKFEKYEGYCNTVWFSEALKYIRKNRDKPFFCYLSTNVPHAPLRVDEKYVEPYAGKVSDRLAHYYGMVSKVDEDISMLMQELKDLGLEENTILVFMTDNGPCPWFGGVVIDFETGFVEEGYSAGMRGGKIWGYENAHRVPFFMRWPAGGIGGGQDIGALAAHIDLMPTLADLCGISVPDAYNIDGISLAPLLRGEELPDRTLFVHNQRIEYPLKDKEYQVLTEQWRLVKREADELYDITTDPGQKNNIASKHPDVVKELYSRYELWWSETSSGFDQYAAMYIGSENENPVTLYAHDAHSRNGKKIWVVKVDRDGRYELRLNRWPEESGKRIVENQNGDMDLPVKSAGLTIGNIKLTKEVTPEMYTAKFMVDLKAGTTCVETELLLEGEGKSLRTDCVYVEYLGESDSESLKSYKPSVPDQVLKVNYEQRVIPYD